MKTFLLASVLVFVGCSKKSDEAAGGDSCGAAINSAVDKMIASRGADAPPAMTEIANKLRTLMTQHCRDDKWPAEVISCFSAATDQPGMKKCRQQLPQDLAQKLQTDIIKVMSAGARDNVRDHGMGGGMAGHGDMGGGSGGAMGGGAPAGSAVPAGSAAPAGSGSAQ